MPRRKPQNRHARSQQRIPGERRLPANTALAKLLETAIQDEMAVYNVSRSWVIASCCAYALGVEIPSYRDEQ